MHSFYHIPSNSRLQNYVTMIWEVNGARDSSEVILPQGIIEIVFNFADQVNGIMPGGAKLADLPRCFIQGIHTHILQSEYIGQHHLLGVRLHSFSIEKLLGVLPSELKNTVLDLTQLSPTYNRLWHQLVELKSFDEKVKLLETELPFLPELVGDRSRAISNLFLAADSERFQNVDKLASEVCYSPRHLNRVVQELYGLSAEELVMYKKFVESVKLIHSQNLSLTEVAYRAGFYDQAHFCRVFKSYTGMTPNYYRKHKSVLPFHIIS